MSSNGNLSTSERGSSDIGRKILHISQTDIHSDSRILKEISSLKKSGYFVKSIGIQGNYETSGCKDPMALDVISIKSFSTRAKYAPKLLKHIILLIELLLFSLKPSLEYRPNIIHCHDAIALAVGVLIGRLINAKIIYDAHELESDRNGLSRSLGYLTLIVEKCLWRFFDALIVVSPSIDKWYQKSMGLKASEVILNSPEIGPSLSVDRRYLHRSFNISRDQKIFIYNGILGPNRGLQKLIQVFSMPEIVSHLVFLGYGPLESRLRSMSVEAPNIHFHAAVPHHEVVSITSSADVGLCLIENCSLSDYYCLPNKLFEYAFAGIPTIGSDFPDIKELSARHNLGTVCSDSTFSIFSAVMSFQRGTSVPPPCDLELISWKQQEKRLVELYERLLID